MRHPTFFIACLCATALLVGCGTLHPAKKEKKDDDDGLSWLQEPVPPASNGSVRSAPENVSPLVAYLASPQAERVSGQGSVLGRGVAGWFGFSLLGTGVGLLSRPMAIGFGVYGAARSVYTNVFGKGRELYVDTLLPACLVLKVRPVKIPEHT